MYRKLYWGLAAFIILIVGATVFVVVKNNSEMPELERELAEFKKQAERQDKPRQPVADNRPPPPSKTFDGGGHWHGDEWHDATDDISNPELIPSDVNSAKDNNVIALPIQESLKKDGESESGITERQKLYQKLEAANKRFADLLPDIDAPNFYDHLNSLTQVEKEAWVEEMRQAMEASNRIIDQLIQVK